MVEKDHQHIQTYFAMYYGSVDGNDDDDSNPLPPVECVAPNAEYATLQEEMEAFKTLDEDAKVQANVNRTMGPGKMTRFIIEMYQKWMVGRDNEQQDERPPGEEAKEDAEHVVAAQEEPADQPQPLHIDPSKTMFACRMCRTVLFGEDHLADNHVQSQHVFLHKHQRMSGNSNGNNPQKNLCQSLFCDESVLPQFHTDNDAWETEGRLQCPNTRCRAKLGHWNWSGAQCSCGTWVVPAIQIPLSKVDPIMPQQRINEDAGSRVGATAVTPSSRSITPVLP
ncbi:MAG: hypothetical protein SGILL_000885 [Bacillariaceae sp.]